MLTRKENVMVNSKSKAVRALIMDVDETIIRTKEYDKAGKPSIITPFIKPRAIDFMQKMQKSGYKIFLITHGSTPTQNPDTGGIIPGHYELLDKLSKYLKSQKIRVVATTETADIAADSRVYFPVLRSIDSPKDRRIYNNNVTRIINEFGKGSLKDFLWKKAKIKAGIKPGTQVEKVLVVGDNYPEVGQADVIRQKDKQDAGVIVLDGGPEAHRLRKGMREAPHAVERLQRARRFLTTTTADWDSRRYGRNTWDNIERFTDSQFRAQKTPVPNAMIPKRKLSWPSKKAVEENKDWNQKVRETEKTRERRMSI